MKNLKKKTKINGRPHTASKVREHTASAPYYMF